MKRGPGFGAKVDSFKNHCNLQPQASRWCPRRFPFRENFRLEIPEIFRVKWKGFLANSGNSGSLLLFPFKKFEPWQSSQLFWTDAILNDTIRNEKKNCDSPWSTLTGKHWKRRKKNPGVSLGPKENCANGTGISVPTGWNGKSGIARRVVRLFRKISGRTRRFICIQTGRSGTFAYMESTLVCSSYYTRPHPIVKYTR